MTYTSFRDKSSFLAEVSQANSKMKELLGKIDIALSEQGFPLRKDTYHFLTRVLQPNGRVERTLYMLLFQAAYQSEIMSSGSAYIAIRFANEFIDQLLKDPDVLNLNQVELQDSLERVLESYRDKVCAASETITETTMKEEVTKACDDPTLAAAIWEALSVSGLEGKIHVEDGILGNYVIEQKSGYYFDALKPFKFMLPKNGIWESSMTKVMLVDGILEKVSELDKILNGAYETKNPLLLIAHGFSEEIIATIKMNVDANKFDIMPVRLTTDLDSLNVVNDIACVCGTDVISTLKGQMVCFTEFDSLPTVEKVRLTMNELSIENVKTRAGVSQQLRMLLEKRVQQHAIEDLSDLIDSRIKSLISAAVTLKLPNMADSKRDSTKVKIDIALRNTKTLLNYGRMNLGDVQVEKTLSRGTIDRAFWKAFEEVRKEVKTIPTLSAYTGVHFVGKTILAMMTSNGLVEIVS